MAKKRRRKKKKGLWNLIKKHKAASAVIALFLVCIIVVAGVIGTIAWNLYHDSIGIVDPDDVDPTADKVQIAREDPKDDDVINVLLVGSDSRDPNAEMGRSDTMILVSYNKAENKATALSFLRDSLVEIDGHGQSKLGHTFAYGGVGETYRGRGGVLSTDRNAGYTGGNSHSHRFTGAGPCEKQKPGQRFRTYQTPERCALRHIQ